MDVHFRRRALAAAVRGGNQVPIRQLAADLDCSEMTIRRDLDVLARDGVLRRIHGGAVGADLRADEVPYAVRVFEAIDAKTSIAKAVAALISDGETVALDSGTTAGAVANALRGRSITLLPLGLRTLVDLAHDERVHLIAPGGDVRPGELVVTGDLAEVAFERLCFDTFILGCCGIDEQHGVTTHVPSDARVKRAAVASARRTIAVADATKLGAVAFGHVCDLAAIDRLVTEADMEQTRDLELAGLRVEHV
jgi:DeoR/GlpR family transcriptional regulator of sugar metabolism